MPPAVPSRPSGSFRSHSQSNGRSSTTSTTFTRSDHQNESLQDPIASTSAVSSRANRQLSGSDVRNPMSTQQKDQTKASDSPLNMEEDNVARKTKKKRPGRGRMMMVKVFYSLSIPRSSSSPSGTSTSTPHLTSSSALDNPAFLAVLDPSLAPSPESERVTTPQPSQTPATSAQSYTCLARLSSPVWVQLVGQDRATSDALGSGPSYPTFEYGKLTLKTCLSAICISRPELVTDASKDYAVSALDPYESSLQLSANNAQYPDNGQGLMEGKGMLSWNLSEKREGTTWVCGKVVSNEGNTSNKRRKLKRTTESGASFNNDDEDNDEDGSEDTLEVWLQLVERPSFTQSQFLTSLRSFAHPGQVQGPVDRANSPRRRVDNSIVNRTFQGQDPPKSSRMNVGDPVKKKRPRDSMETQSGPSPQLHPTHSITSASKLSNSVTPLSQDSQVLTLLSQLLPSLAQTHNNSSGEPLMSPPFTLDSEQGRALLPAIRALASLHGVSLPNRQSTPVEGNPTGSEGSSQAQGLTKKPMKKKGREVFVTIPQQASTNGNSGSSYYPQGCSNCERRRSAAWREHTSGDGHREIVCNACGIYYNKHGCHRPQNSNKGTSPASSRPFEPSREQSRGGGRPLQPRLTATCEADLRKQKKKHGFEHTHTRTLHRPGMIPPPSPSKAIGPNRSPGLSFKGLRHKTTAGTHAMTSPGRSPRLRARFGQPNFGAGGGGGLFGTMTSPVRHYNGKGTGVGLRSGYDSDNDTRTTSTELDFGNLFSVGSQSPSPKRGDHHHGGIVPSYLLTASPGTALNRILNETNIDLNNFESMPVAMNSGHHMTLANQHHHDHQQQHGDEHDDLSLYLNDSSPMATTQKENERPFQSSHIAEGNGNDSVGLSTTDGPSTDFESILSSLRRDFSNRLSSNAMTSPSSPVPSPTPSSPCVKPRTSSATPGRKGKAPESCGRPAPSILNSFMDGLIPALALSHADGTTPGSESEGWTPASGGGGGGGDIDHDRTMTLSTEMHDGNSNSKSNNTTLFDLEHLLQPLRKHRSVHHLPAHMLSAACDAPANEVDFGSLPPSSPPALPSDAFPTPSDMELEITPDEGMYESEPTMATTTTTTTSTSSMTSPSKLMNSPNKTSLNQNAVIALLESLGLPSSSQQLPLGSAVEEDGVSKSRTAVHHDTHNHENIGHSSGTAANGFSHPTASENHGVGARKEMGNEDMHEAYERLFSQAE